AKTPEGGWVIGWNWDESQWEEPPPNPRVRLGADEPRSVRPAREPLTPEDLDAVSTKHKVLARRTCGHKLVVNAAGLASLDLREDLPGLVHDNGRLTGLITEDAAYEAWEQCAPTFETCVKGLRIESKKLAQLGITSIADTSWHREVQLLTAGAREGWFLQRSAMYVHEDLLSHLKALHLGAMPNDRCALLGVKTYADGSIGARTAAMREPYEDPGPGPGPRPGPADRGMLLRSPKEIESLARTVHGLGLQLKAHAIGDAAIDAVIDGVEAAEVPRTARPRLEHGELLHADHLERMRELGMVASMQPNFIGNWQHAGGLYEERLGKARTLAMNPIKSILDAGVPLAFSSDGMPYGPLYGIACATQHPDPKERITVEQGITAYTRGAAYALGMEHERGVLKAGALGDAVVLAEDPRRARDVAKVRVERTIIGGRAV
ncbi:MAG: amidohydrolase, partial [Myxococcota bacterium]